MTVNDVFLSQEAHGTMNSSPAARTALQARTPGRMSCGTAPGPVKNSDTGVARPRPIYRESRAATHDAPLPLRGISANLTARCFTTASLYSGPESASS